MKIRINKTWLAGCAAGAALAAATACSGDIAPEAAATTGSGSRLSTVPLCLTAGPDEALTRAGADIQSTVFDAGETLNAYITASDGTVVASPVQCVTGAAVGGLNPLTPAVQPYFPQDQSATLDIYALYPQTVTGGTTTFSVCPDQREDADYKASDLMYASVTGVTRAAGATTTTVNLPFSHKMAKLIVEVKVEDAASVGTVTGVTLKNVCRRTGLTAKTGTLDDTQLADQGDILFSTDGSSSACLFPPQSLQRGDFLEVTTDKGTAAAFALNLTTAVALKEGCTYPIELHLGAQNLKEVAVISEWPEDKGLKVEALGAGTIQIDEIPDIDLTATPAPTSPYIPATVTVRSGGDVLTEGTDYTLTYYNNTSAGYAVVVATGNGTYAGKTAARSYLIKQGSAVITTYPTAINRTYDGEEQNLVTAAVAQAIGATVPVKYCLTQNGSYSTTIPQATNAGTYTVWYRVDATNTYSGIDPQKVEVTIDKAPVATGSYTAPTAITGLTYNEQWRTLVNAGSSTVGTITYCLGTDATTAPTSGYTTDLPKGQNAGTYYVWWQVGDDNHEGTTPQCVTVTIGKSAGRITISPETLNFLTGKGSTKTITVNRAGGGTVTATSTNTTDISLSVSADGTKITLTRLTDKNVSNINVVVNVAASENCSAVSATCTVNLSRIHLKLSEVKSTDQKYVGYLVSTTGYIYPATEEGMEALTADGPSDGVPNAQAAGIIAYVGTTNTSHGFVLALHDCNGGATCTFSQAPTVASAYTPTISGYSWILGTYDKYNQALSNYDAVDTAAGSYWDNLLSIHWTATYEWGYEYCYSGSNFICNHRGNTHVDNCKVRSLLAF